jgi:hypothetical protein
MIRVSLAKDHLAAILLVMVGVGVVARGIAYGPGTLRHIGPGFMPIVFGALLAVVGVLIGITSLASRSERELRPTASMIRLGACILAGIFAFILLATHGGFAPASFACVFLAAIGNRENSLAGATLLALVLAVAGSAVFAWALNLGIPAFGWS